MAGELKDGCHCFAATGRNIRVPLYYMLGRLKPIAGNTIILIKGLFATMLSASVQTQECKHSTFVLPKSNADKD